MAADVLHSRPQSAPISTFDTGILRSPTRTSQESVDCAVNIGVPQDDLKDAWPPMCVYPVWEVLQTEKVYVLALNDMLKGYRTPLKNWLQASQYGETFVKQVFSNLEQLFNTHSQLLQNLRSTATDPREFGQVFVKAENEFSQYTEYCTNFNTASQLLREATEANKDLKDFLEICQRDLGHNLSLDSYLIKPVQRILKYHLLLHQILKHFNTEHHAHPSLTKALHVMTRTAVHINDVKRQMENSVRVKEIQQSLYGGPSRKLTSYGELLYECKCKVHVGKKGAERERELILFDKLLLLLKRKDSKRYNYKGHIEVGELGLEDVVSEPTVFQVFPRLRRSPTYHITVRSERVKQEWMDRIKEIIHCNTEEMKRCKRQEMSVIMRKKRFNSEPRASNRTHQLMSVQHGSRKRKALSEIFPLSQNDDAAQLRKVSRIHPEEETDDGTKEGEREGEREEDWVMNDREQRLPDDSGVVLPPISEEEGSIFSNTQTSDFLQPTRYLGTSKMTSSVSMESLVSIGDVEIEDAEEETLSHEQLGGRYVEECDYGGEVEGEEGREGKGRQQRMMRSSSSLRRKPAIRVKRNSVGSPALHTKHGSRSSTHQDSVIREKAQMARAESLDFSHRETKTGSHIEADGPQLADLIGAASMMKSCNSSLNSSTGLTNGHSAVENFSPGVSSSSSEFDSSSASVATGLIPLIVTSQEDDAQGGEYEGDATAEEKQMYDTRTQEEISSSTEALLSPLSDDCLQDTADEIEIVDSSDSEEEDEEDEEEEISMEEELSSSVEQPTTNRQHSSASREGQTAEETEEPFLSNVQPASSDSNTATLAMEDSGFGTGGSASWKSVKTTDSEVAAGSESENERSSAELPSTRTSSPPPFQFKGTTDPSVSATMPRDKARTYAKSSLPTPPQTLIIPHDISPGPRSRKSSSPSSTSSSISRTALKKSKGFSRLIEFTRKLSTPAYLSEVDRISQSLPPGGISGEELSDFDNIFAEMLQSGEEMESVMAQDSASTPPPPKKQALQLSHDSDEVAVEMKSPQYTDEVVIETVSLQDVVSDVSMVAKSPVEASEVAIETVSPQDANEIAMVTESPQDTNEVVIETVSPQVTEPIEDEEHVEESTNVKADHLEMVGVEREELRAEDVLVESTEPASEDDRGELMVGVKDELPTEDVLVESTEPASEDDELPTEDVLVESTEPASEDDELPTEDVLVESTEPASEDDRGELMVGVEIELKDELHTAQVVSTEPASEDDRGELDGAEMGRLEEDKEEEVEVRPVEMDVIEPTLPTDHNLEELETAQQVSDKAVDDHMMGELAPPASPIDRVKVPTESGFAHSLADQEMLLVEETSETVSEEEEEGVAQMTSTAHVAEAVTAATESDTEENKAVEKLEDLQAKELEVGVVMTASSHIPPSYEEGITVVAAEAETEAKTEEEQYEKEVRDFGEESEQSADAEKGREMGQKEKYDHEEEIATESQLSQRHTRVLEADATLYPTPMSDTTTVAQTNIPLSFFRAMQRRLQRWGAGHVCVLMLGFGFLTVASFFLLGFNFFYDTANDAQTIASPPL